MSKRKPDSGAKLSDDEGMILWPFIDQAEKGDDELAKYMFHCAITAQDLDAAGDNQSAILAHYRRPDGRYDIDAAAHDLMRWPPTATRIKELKRAKLQIAAKCRNPQDFDNS